MRAVHGSSASLALCMFLVLLAIQTPAHADEATRASEYRPGLGWQVPGTSLKLGGYLTASFEDLRGSGSAVALDDLSLFGRWEGEGRLRAFAEITLESPLVYSRGPRRTSSSYVALERLYADYLYSDRLNFRAGKFLTPIGRWNSVHAGPLVWTTSRPLITEQTFPTNATGVMAFGTIPVFGKSVDYSIYSAVGEEWRPDPKLDPFDNAFGVHAVVSVSANTEIGLSLASFDQQSAVGERRNLVGFDYFWTRHRYELDAEAVYRFSEQGARHDEKGLSVQGVAPLTQGLYAVGRYEFYDQAGAEPPVNLWLVGLTLKTSSALVFKVEWRKSSTRQALAPDGLMASFSALF